MNEIKANVIRIYTQKMAGYLMLKGFPLIDIKPDRYNPEKHNFIFTYNDDLQKEMDSFLASRKKINRRNL